MNTPTPSAHSGEQGKPSYNLLRDAITSLRNFASVGVDRGPVSDAWLRAMELSDAALRELDRSEELERSSPEQSEPVGEVVVTRDAAGAIVAVTRQDSEGRILSTIANAPPPTSEQECPNCISPWKCNGPHIGRQPDFYAADREDEAIPSSLGESPSEQAGISCGTCEGTGLANVVDQDDGALVIDDCPECGGESASSRGVGSGEALADAGAKLYNAMTMQEQRESGVFHIPQPSARRIWDEAKEAWEKALTHPAPEAQADAWPQDRYVTFSDSGIHVDVNRYFKSEHGRAALARFARRDGEKPSASETPSAKDAGRLSWLLRQSLQTWINIGTPEYNRVRGHYMPDRRALIDAAIEAENRRVIAAQRKEGES